MFSFETAALDAGARPALVTASEILTFDQLAARARRVVADLAARLPAGRPVALVPTVRAETVVAIYALLELGAPIVLLHPRLTSAERSALVATVDASLVLDETWTDRDLPELEAPQPPRSPRTHDPESVMAVLFTSGSSGSPKGVVLSRRAFAAAAQASAANLRWQEDDRWLLCMPIAHVGGLSVIVRCLLARVPIVLSPWTGSVDALLGDVARQRATILSLVPTMLSRILEVGPAQPFPAPVRAVFLGGDAARPTLLAAAAERAVPVLTTYGLTEACSQVATQSYGEPSSLDGAIGPPLPGVEIRIAGGEVQVRGANLFSGYFPLSSTPSPFVDDGWFPTGDQGELDAEGRLRIRGRRSDLIITGGENVDPAEIERVLSSVAGVRDVCVFGVPDERWGQIVGLAVVPSEAEAPVSFDALARAIRERLASHKQPRVAALCAAIPMNATGKIDRRATAALVAPSLVVLPR